MRHSVIPGVIFLSLIAAGVLPALAQDKPQDQSQEKANDQVNAEYEKVIDGRAQQVLEKLDLKDQEKAAQVKEAVKNYYRGLNEVDAKRDAERAKLKAGDQKPSAEQEKALKDQSQKEADAVVARLDEQLSKVLSPEQVEAVKDALTYNVRKVTINAYNDMIPRLTDEQKAYIKEQLHEARDKALTGGSSDAKHAWFGKYKGRINNYLSKQGYDLKKETRDWAERRKQAASQPDGK